MPAATVKSQNHPTAYRGHPSIQPDPFASDVRQRTYLERSAQLRHDISNVICVVQMRLHILKKSRTVSDEQLNTFQHCTSRLNALLESWRQLDVCTRNPDGEDDQEFDVGALVTRILDAYHPMIQAKQQQLIVRGQGRIGKVTGSPVQFERLIDNLISNACKYTPRGGVIEVSIKCHNGQIQLSVADRGIGIPEQELAHIFIPYYRATTARANNITGSGLGLAIVKEVVDQLGGEISVRSQADSGTVFVVTLPIACT